MTVRKARAVKTCIFQTETVKWSVLILLCLTAYNNCFAGNFRYREYTISVMFCYNIRKYKLK